MKLFSRETKADNTNNTRSTITSAVITAVATAATSALATFATKVITEAINSNKVDDECEECNTSRVNVSSKEITINCLPFEGEIIQFIANSCAITHATTVIDDKKYLMIKDSRTGHIGVYPITSDSDWSLYDRVRVYVTTKGVYIEPKLRMAIVETEPELVKDSDGVWKIKKPEVDETSVEIKNQCTLKSMDEIKHD